MVFLTIMAALTFAFAFLLYIYTSDTRTDLPQTVLSDREKREVRRAVERALVLDQKTTHADVTAYSNYSIIKNTDGSYAVTLYPSVVYISPSSSPLYTNIQVAVSEERKNGIVAGYGVEDNFSVYDVGATIPVDEINFYEFSPESAEVIAFIDRAMKMTEEKNGYNFSPGLDVLSEQAPFVIKEQGNVYQVLQQHANWRVQFAVEKQTGRVREPLVMNFDRKD